MSAAECDAGLKMLALAGLPRATTGTGSFEEVRAVYLDLLRDAGVTGEMLKAACRRYIMQPALAGKAKFFPDPGQLAELCAEDIRERRERLKALEDAVLLIEAPPPREQEEMDREKVAAELHDLSNKLRVGPLRPAPAPRARPAAPAQRPIQDVVDEMRSERGEGGAALAERYLQARLQPEASE